MRKKYFCQRATDNGEPCVYVVNLQNITYAKETAEQLAFHFPDGTMLEIQKPVSDFKILFRSIQQRFKEFMHKNDRGKNK